MTSGPKKALFLHLKIQNSHFKPFLIHVISYNLEKFNEQILTKLKKCQFLAQICPIYLGKIRNSLKNSNSFWKPIFHAFYQVQL